MYGVESAVHPDYRGYGIGRRLMDARKRVLRQLNLRGMLCGSAIIDYHSVADTMSAQQYMDEVIAKQRFDTNLSKQLKMGFTATHLIPGYLPDADCCGWGVEIVWHNPDYVPVAAPRQVPVRPLIPVYTPGLD
jgi:ribosomal protein S18 acetylase RimI-like enzyme